MEIDDTYLEESITLTITAPRARWHVMLDVLDQAIDRDGQHLSPELLIQLSGREDLFAFNPIAAAVDSWSVDIFRSDYGEFLKACRRTVRRQCGLGEFDEGSLDDPHG